MCLSATALWVANEATRSAVPPVPTLNGDVSGVDAALEEAIEPSEIPPLGIGAEMEGVDTAGLVFGCGGTELTGGFTAAADALEPSASSRRSRKSVSRRP